MVLIFISITNDYNQYDYIYNTLYQCFPNFFGEKNHLQAYFKMTKKKNRKKTKKKIRPNAELVNENIQQ